MTYRLWRSTPLYLLAALFFALPAFASMSTGPIEPLIFSDIRIETAPNGMKAVGGNVRNTTRATIKNIWVKLDLYKNGEFVGQTMDQKTALAAGEVWSLRGVFNDGEPDEVRIAEVSTD